MRRLKTLSSIRHLKGKRVLLREDFNVPIKLEEGKIHILDDERIRAAVPTIQFLQKKGAIVVLFSHLGRPHTSADHHLSLYPVGKLLGKILHKNIEFVYDVFEPELAKRFADAPAGHVFLCENIRFFPEEEANDSTFAKHLATLGDCFVMDAFATAHRDDATTEGITHYLPSVAGPLLEKEITALSAVMENPKRPFVAVLGGAKISTKLGLLNQFLQNADRVILGGALMNTFFAAHGISVGKSAVETKMFEEVRKIPLDHPKLVLPVDVVVAQSLEEGTNMKTKKIGDIDATDFIGDIGEVSIKRFSDEIFQAKQIVWNGPMGFYEKSFFGKGTNGVARAVAKVGKNAIIGGGETVDAVRDLKLDAKISFISTGGGAMLEFLEGKELPGITNLYQ